MDDPVEHPPSADRIAARALVLACTACRAGIEQDHGNPDAEGFREQVIEWAGEIGIDGEFEPAERTFLATPLGALADEQVLNDAHWSSEGIVMLAWALGEAERPPHDEAPMPHEVANHLGFLQARDDTVLNGPELRPLSEIRHLREMLFALHWRLMQFSLTREAMDFRSFASTAWFGPFELGDLPFAGTDIAVRGVALADAPQDHVAMLHSLTMERRRALEWLCGQAELYSDVELNT